MTKPLTFAAVKRLVAAGESETLELKRTTGELREAGQTLCGFLNQRGGVVVFGVAADGRIVGQEVNDGTLRDVAAAVRDIDPAPQVGARRIDAGGARLKLVKRQTRSRIEDGPAILDYRGPRIPIACMHGGLAMKKAAKRARC